MSDLPTGWKQRESKSHPGKIYYFNESTGESSWDKPASFSGATNEQVQVFHILRKHAGSRRPASWRLSPITQSIADACAEVIQYRDQLRSVLAEKGADAMFQLFCQIAQKDSDCGSHDRGGDLGMFGRGQMQRAFEEASFALRVGELSDLVETDSGVHILLRTK